MANSNAARYAEIAAGVVAMFGGALDSGSEPVEYARLRKLVSVVGYGYGQSLPLEWHLIRTIMDEHHMMTCDYLLYYPGRGVNGDIDGLAEIYNPEGSDYLSGDYPYVILEYSRFGWGTVDLTTPRGTYHFPSVHADDVIQPGYLTTRIYR